MPGSEDGQMKRQMALLFCFYLFIYTCVSTWGLVKLCIDEKDIDTGIPSQTANKYSPKKLKSCKFDLKSQTFMQL